MLDRPELTPKRSKFSAACGTDIIIYGEAGMSLTFGDVVLQYIVGVANIKHNLLGADFIFIYRCDWCHDEQCFNIRRTRVPFDYNYNGRKPGRVIAAEYMFVPVICEAIIKSMITNGSREARRGGHNDCLGILTPELRLMEKNRLAIARTLVDASHDIVYTRVLNLSDNDVKVYKKHSYGFIYSDEKIG